MKSIYLKNINTGSYEKFSYNLLSEVKDELGSRNILLQNNAQKFGDKVRLGINVTIGLNTEVKDSVVIEDGAYIKDNVKIKDRAFIGSGSLINNDVLVSEDCIISNDVTLGEGVKIGKFAKVDGGTTLTDKFLLIGSVGEITYVGNGKIAIGCISSTPEKWLNSAQSLGNEYGYTQQQYQEYLYYIKAAQSFINNLTP